MRNAILTISSAAKTATSGKFGAVLKSTLFAVLLAAASMAGAVPIPGTPVPITLQTFVVMLAALMLPWKQAGAAVLMYLAAGAAGLPVFAGFNGGVGALLGPTGGFLWGFVLGSALAGLAAKALEGGLAAYPRSLACAAALVLVSYACGTVQLMALMNLDLMGALAIAVFPFILPDAVKIAVGARLGCTVARAIR